ncbi:prolyl aminopeptidase [Lentzea flava]|uniref:Proline iminopeptidase n=1 Tax=Lentzea flava TaxID=103732 RepID=A0ABQ2UU30_9PSEU|nr:prolyl aminopeptidase [Lentzea flava]MCP2201363.1 proline iminopeptidase [Lentzea flava]GGU51566.1 putative proline iminopeptidase [Lentzea flava]
MYPQVEPYAQGMLDVGDNQHIHWEASGNPHGKPAVVFHGGPGSGSNPVWRQDFDPDHWNLILWDQRGTGKSTPPASDPDTSMEHNTTQHLIDDAEKLREHLGIEKWLLMGGSWGSTLILAYAVQHPERVSEIIIPAVTAGRPEELEWITRGLGMFYPDYFEAFRNGVPEEEREGNLARAYNKLLNDPDPEVREKAAWDWNKWDLSTITGGDNDFTGTRYEDPVTRYRMARVVTHYWGNDCFLEPNYIFDNLGSLSGIPGVLIHGRNDFGSPLSTAWEVARRWPDAELVILNDAGHQASDGGSMSKAIADAVERFR